MVLGCSSAAGKSLLATALARWFARQGVDVVPFKAQNVSNNARVVSGGEIGVAQWLQARAAGLEPTVDMNPVLLKPEADTRSQVVVSGVARHDLTVMPWPERGPHLWPQMVEAYDRLAAAHHLVLIEGAGSPAEINLPDLVNNGVLAHADAVALLVADIDRGGAFAHLYGTWALVPEPTRRRLAGFVLNRFRGDAGLLEPGPSMVTEMTGMPCVGVLPMLAHELPDEEGGSIRATCPRGAPTVAVVRYPYASNLDEFHLLAHAARMRWATSPSDLAGADLVILPGSKHVAADARWLQDRALDEAITAHARSGAKVLGICGGAMLLGTEVTDRRGIEGATTGLGLLPIRTEMAPDKLTRQVSIDLPDLPHPWRHLSGLRTSGYEIRNGRIAGDNCQLGPMIWARGGALATTVHGLLEDSDVLAALTGTKPPQVLERTFDLLADAVDAHLDGDLLRTLVHL
jgi:adenosylcobyric acid synthase